MSFFSASSKGFSLIETIVGVAVFVIIIASLFNAYLKIMGTVRLARLKITATALANEQFEITRNLPYADVGISGGVPEGVLNHTQTLVRDNTSFIV